MMKYWGWGSIVLTLAWLLAMPATADPLVATGYSKPARTFRVGMLLLESQTKPDDSSDPLDNTTIPYWNSDPWLLPVLNHSPFKPNGWVLENPLAAGVLANDAQLIVSGNFYSRDGKGGLKRPAGMNPSDSTVFYPTNWYLNGKKPGDAITKDDPAYWMVKLEEKSLEALSRFDLLILNGHSDCALSSTEINYLRFLLEHGATVWVNNSQRSGLDFKELFFIDPPIKFKLGPYGKPSEPNPSSALTMADPENWLLNGYYRLTSREVIYLRDNVTRRDFIESGVAGYPGGETSLLTEVVRLSPVDKANWGYGPAIAAGRVGNGQVIATAVDIIGAAADWWEYKHNYNGLNNPDIWPYTRSMHTQGAVNRALCYPPSCKFIFNMLATPASMHMVGGNTLATRSYAQEHAPMLSPGWKVDGFTTLSDPVSLGSYVAVTGNTDGSVAAEELRVYRTRRTTDDDGTVLDYPYGLYDENTTLVTPMSYPVSPVATPTLRQWWNYYPNDARPDSEMDLCFTIPAAHWVGSPVFGRVTDTITVPGIALSRTVLYALEAFVQGDGSYAYRPRCFAIDPYISANAYDESATDLVNGQVGTDLWAYRDDLSFTAEAGGVPRASMTLSNGRLVITTFGKTTDNSPWRIYLVDGATGDFCVAMGGGAQAKEQFRLTGPASIIHAEMEVEATPLETTGAADAVTQGADNNPNTPELLREGIELLVAPGEYYSDSAQGIVSGQPAVFLIPPMLSARLGPPNGQLTRIPWDLRLIEGADPQTADQSKIHQIGSPTSEFRQKHVLAVKVNGPSINIIFKSWDVFFPRWTPSRGLWQIGTVYRKDDSVTYHGQGYQCKLGHTASVATTPGAGANWTSYWDVKRTGAKLPLTLAFSPESSGRNTDTPPQQNAYGNTVLISGLMPAMGYPLLLPSYQHFNLADRSTLRVGDGDDKTGFGYRVDSPLLVMNDQIVVGTDAGTLGSRPLLLNSASAVSKNIYGGGSLSGYLIQHPGLSKNQYPLSYPSQGNLAWRFFGDTFGPRDTVPDALWRSDFPYPPAADDGTIYTVGAYRGYGNYDGSGYVSLAQTATNRGMLYAIDPEPSYYLRQVVSAAAVNSHADTDPHRLRVVPLAKLETELRVGARALLKGSAPAPFTWDMGKITAIRKDPDFATNKSYWVTFERSRPNEETLLGADVVEVMVATSVPHLSHVMAWNSVSGVEPSRRYTANVYDETGAQIDQFPVTRVSEGISSTAPTGASASPLYRPYQQATSDEVMIAFTGLEYTCHQPDSVVETTLPGATTSYSLAPDDHWHDEASGEFRPDTWDKLNHVYLPRFPIMDSTNRITGAIELNYTVDHRMGRIALRPEIAGEFADRFVVVHYFTEDMVGGVAVKQRHAEIMYIPSQIKWQYQFTNEIPDSGPVLVNDVIYVTALRKEGASWRPVLYAFAATPQNPLDVAPLWAQPLNTTVTPSDPSDLPYRGVTSAIPTPNGVVVGTAFNKGDDPSVVNTFENFTDRGMLIADGHRVLRVNGAGTVTWQASATKDFDPRALALSGDTDLASQVAGVVQQGFTLITRIQKLPNGNILVCDTGGNRVVEMDRDGNVVWQYPDGDLTYQDPDLAMSTDTNDNQYSDPLHSNTYLNAAIRRATPSHLRINGPRDVRRYTLDREVANVYWDIDNNGGLDNLGPATIRWESTLITDAGNNRIIEVNRPLVRFEDIETLNTTVVSGKRLEFARGFCYRPDVSVDAAGTVKLAQFVEVLADSATLRKWDGKGIGQKVSFTSAMRYSGPDERLQDTQTDATVPARDGVRTRELLAVIGNAVKDPLNPGKDLRVVRLSVPVSGGAAVVRTHATLTAPGAKDASTLPVDYTSEFMVGDAVTIRDMTTGIEQSLGTVTVINGNDITVSGKLAQTFPTSSRLSHTRSNAIAIRPAADGKPSGDFTRVWQLDLVKLWDPYNARYVQHALVVDNTGVREVSMWPTEQSTPVFEMTAAEYKAALSDAAGWGSDIKAWRNDDFFAPVAMMRLDQGNGVVPSDPRQTRYLVMQMNPTASAKQNTWINGKAERRINFFEARWTDPTIAYDATTLRTGWGILDAQGRYFLYPHPSSPDYPNLPGWTYSLTQPLSFDRD